VIVIVSEFLIKIAKLRSIDWIMFSKTISFILSEATIRFHLAISF